MPIPDFQSVMRPILATVANSTPLALSELGERIADEFQLSKEERSERLPSGKQTVINNRVGWARTYLNKAGLLSIPAKGMVQITERGREVLDIRDTEDGIRDVIRWKSKSWPFCYPKNSTLTVQCLVFTKYAQLRYSPPITLLSAHCTCAKLRTISLGLLRFQTTHNPLVVGSSPTGPTILKAAHCAAFVFPGFGVLLF